MIYFYRVATGKPTGRSQIVEALRPQWDRVSLDQQLAKITEPGLILHDAHTDETLVSVQEFHYLELKA